MQIIQSKGGTTSGPVLTISLDQVPQNGNSLIAVVQWVGTRGPVTLGGVTASPVSVVENGLRKVGIFAVHGVNSATVVCRVPDDDESAVSMQVFELSSLVNAPAESVSTAIGSGTNITAGAVSASSPANFVVGGIVGGGNGYTTSNMSPDSVNTLGNASMYGFCIGYATRTNDTSAIAMTRTLTIGGPWAGCSAVFGAS